MQSPRNSRQVLPRWLRGLRYIFLTWLLVSARTPGWGQSPPRGKGAPATTAAPPTVTTACECSPYRRQIWVAATASAEVDADALDQLRREIARQADALVGAPWSVSVAPPPAPLAMLMAHSPQ